MPFRKLKACLRRVVERTVPRLYRRIGSFARSLTAPETRNYFRRAAMRKITNLLLDAKNRRFYLADKIEDFFGLPRRKSLYRRDGLRSPGRAGEPQVI